ncbi:MAG: hypothetical protein IK130_10380, partial [Oscillospiraceae bacterium]|nr:hypothetical protein [Oscillospiraceae bacterium]
MTDFYAEHSTLTGLLMLAGLAMMFGWLSLTIRLIQVRNFRKYTAVSVGFTLLSFAFYIMLRIRLEIMPVLLLICGFAVQTVLLTLAAWMVRRQTGSQLSSMSFKEAFDTLPTGLCFYQEGGMPRLVNLQMEYLCRRITGAHLSNAEEFFWYLREGNCSGSVTGGESPIICLSDGTAFCFTHHLLEYQGEMLHELIAADITEQYQMTLEMERKQKQIRLINKRLRALNSTMRFIIMEKEVLSLKTKIHDELGKALLLCRRYLMHPKEAEAEEIRAQWRVSFGLLLNEKRETWQKPYLINTKQAMLLGVKLEVEGDLPEE